MHIPLINRKDCLQLTALWWPGWGHGTLFCSMTWLPWMEACPRFTPDYPKPPFLTSASVARRWGGMGLEPAGTSRHLKPEGVMAGHCVTGRAHRVWAPSGVQSLGAHHSVLFPCSSGSLILRAPPSLSCCLGLTTVSIVWAPHLFPCGLSLRTASRPGGPWPGGGGRSAWLCVSLLSWEMAFNSQIFSLQVKGRRTSVSCKGGCVTSRHSQYHLWTDFTCFHVSLGLEVTIFNLTCWFKSWNKYMYRRFLWTKMYILLPQYRTLEVSLAFSSFSFAFSKLL